MTLIIDLTENELAKLEEITKTSFYGAEIDSEVSDAISKLIEAEDSRRKESKMNKLGLNIPEQPSIPPMPKKKAAVNRQVIVTWFTPEEKLPEEDIGVLATVTARAKNREFIRAILTVFYCKSEGWYELDYGFTELTVHAWCDLEPYEGD